MGKLSYLERFSRNPDKKHPNYLGKTKTPSNSYKIKTSGGRMFSTTASSASGAPNTADQLQVTGTGLSHSQAKQEAKRKRENDRVTDAMQRSGVSSGLSPLTLPPIQKRQRQQKILATALTGSTNETVRAGAGAGLDGIGAGAGGGTLPPIEGVAVAGVRTTQDSARNAEVRELNDIDMSHSLKEIEKQILLAAPTSYEEGMTIEKEALYEIKRAIDAVRAYNSECSDGITAAGEVLKEVLKMIKVQKDEVPVSNLADVIQIYKDAEEECFLLLKEILEDQYKSKTELLGAFMNLDKLGITFPEPEIGIEAVSEFSMDGTLDDDYKGYNVPILSRRFAALIPNIENVNVAGLSMCIIPEGVLKTDWKKLSDLDITSNPIYSDPSSGLSESREVCIDADHCKFGNNDI